MRVGLCITYPEASSAPPPPSLAPAWAAERTRPSRQPWPGSADPGPHRSPQSRLLLFS